MYCNVCSYTPHWQWGLVKLNVLMTDPCLLTFHQAVEILVWIKHINKKGNQWLIVFFPSLPLTTRCAFSDPFPQVDWCDLWAEKSTREQDPLIYNFIKSVNEKHGQETRICQCRQEEQSAWLKVRSGGFGAKKLITYPLLQNCLIFFHHHRSPDRAALFK